VSHSLHLSLAFLAWLVNSHSSSPQSSSSSSSTHHTPLSAAALRPAGPSAYIPTPCYTHVTFVGNPALRPGLVPRPDLSAWDRPILVWRCCHTAAMPCSSSIILERAYCNLIDSRRAQPQLPPQKNSNRPDKISFHAPTFNLCVPLVARSRDSMRHSHRSPSV
jgi:hypothetical protein